jgi:hypothetical protein
METMTEQEFEKLCEDVYAEREEIYPLIPNLSRRDALLWMLLGSLVSLLSVPVEEQPDVDDSATSDPYGDAIIELLRHRTRPAFDPQIYLAKLSDKPEA